MAVDADEEIDWEKEIAEERTRERRSRIKYEKELSAEKLYKRGEGYYLSTQSGSIDRKVHARQAYSDLTRAALLFEKQGQSEKAYEAIKEALIMRRWYNPAGTLREDKKRLERMRKAAQGDKGTLVGAVASILGFAGALFFLSSGITGFVISNINSSTSNYLGVVFLIVGLIGLFFYIKKKK